MTDTGAQVIATFLLAEPVAPPSALILEAVGETLALTAHPAGPDGAVDGVPLVLTGPGGLALGRLVDGPLPAELIERVAEAAWWWPAAPAAAARHRAHLAIGCPWTGHTRLEAHVKHTLLVRAVLEHVPALGVVWGGVLVSPDQVRAMFSEMVMEKRLPIPLWVKVDLARHDDGGPGTLATTTGLAAFGLMEIEAHSATLAPGALFELVRSLSQYLVANGAVIADGDRIGESEATPIVVRHDVSLRDAARRVYRLEPAA